MENVYHSESVLAAGAYFDSSMLVMKLEEKCDFSSNNNVWTRFYAFFVIHFSNFVFFIMTN